MVELINVNKTFGSIIAVDGLSFHVKNAENLILLGTSGCGKTTALKMINRLIEPDSGTILINGKNILDQKKELLRRDIGYVMQNNGLFPHFTVEQNISVVPKLLNWDTKTTALRINELLEKMHLPDHMLQKYPHQISGGQQQRVGLARAIIANTPLLLMDEPFGALDNVTRSEIQKEFIAMEEFQQKTIIMVTHDVQEAFELGDRIALMHHGKIVQIGTPKQLLYEPLNSFTKDFLAGHKLALSLKLVKIDDLWQQFNLIIPSGGECLSSKISVWDAMEHFLKEENKMLQLSNLSGEIKSINFENLTAAFRQYQISQGND